MVEELLQQYWVIIGLASIFGLIGGYISAKILHKRCIRNLQKMREEPQAKLVTTQPTQQASGQDTHGSLGTTTAPKPIKPKIEPSPQELEKQKLDLITSFPELDVIMSNLDDFKALLSTQKLEVPETITPTEILTARRISDMLYKHQKVLLGTSRLTKERLFAATINLLKKS